MLLSQKVKLDALSQKVKLDAYNILIDYIGEAIPLEAGVIYNLA